MIQISTFLCRTISRDRWVSICSIWAAAYVLN